ncbi:MAG: glycosyltransferase family 4 protein [Saprospiraceae bacterium]
MSTNQRSDKPSNNEATNQLNILLIHQYFLEDGDGGGSRWNEMCRMWNEDGHRITVLAGMVHYNSGLKAERYKGKFTFVDKKNDRLTVIRSHVSEAYNVSFLGRLWAYFSFVFSSLYAGFFKTRGKYDVIIVTSPPLFVGITAYFLSLFKRIPFVFEIRDLWPESAIDTGVLKNGLIIKMAFAFESFIYRKSKLINVLTPAFRSTLIENKQVPANKVVLIPNAADFALSEELLQTFDVEGFRKEHNLNNRFVITYVGAHGVANHLIQAVDTAEILRKSHPEVLFLLIGEGMEKAMLKKEVEKRGIADSIRFIDAVPKKEVFKYILASDVGTSILKKVDTFKTVYSNKTFDYMSCKKPIFMLIDGVSRELVEDAQCGEYIEPENPQLFAQVIEKYLSQSVSLQKMGENGYAYAHLHFDREVLSEKYISIVKNVIGKK